VGPPDKRIHVRRLAQNGHDRGTARFAGGKKGEPPTEVMCPQRGFGRV
jgi:hypothetical protein